MVCTKKIDRLDPVLTGRFVSLAPLTPSLLPRIAEMIVQTAELGRWRLDRQTGGDDAIMQSLTAGVAKQRVIIRNSSTEVVGLCQLMNVDWRSSRGELTVLVAPQYWGRAWPMEGLGLFIQEAFETTPLRKLSAEVLPFVMESIHSGVGRYFRIDGVLAESEYYDGEYLDVTLLSIDRATWPFDRRTTFSGEAQFSFSR